MPAVKDTPRVKHIPQRTCVGCRKVMAKRHLIRVVRTPQGLVEADTSGKKSGRGAYLCPDISCWERALKRGGLDRALKVSLTPQSREALLTFATALAPAGTSEVR